MRERVQAAHMRLVSDFEVGHMRIVKQENYMREEQLGGYRMAEVQIHKKTAGYPLFWVQGVYKKEVLVHKIAQVQVDQASYTRIEVREVHMQAGVKVVCTMAEVQQVYMWVAQQKDYLRVGRVHHLIQAG